MNVEECCQALLAYTLPIADKERSHTCIDVGVGTFAFYCELFAKLEFPTVAVEPLPVDAVVEMCRNYGIPLIESCLSDVSGTVNLQIGNYLGNTEFDLNFSSIISDWWGVSAEVKQVQSMTLPQLLAEVNIEAIACLKLDIEGAESLVIPQLTELPESLLPQIVMFEYGGGDTRASSNKGWSPKLVSATMKCLARLQQCGYGFSIMVDYAADTKELVFDLQSLVLESDRLFYPQAVYGNIICVRGIEFPPDEIAQVCAVYH